MHPADHASTWKRLKILTAIQAVIWTLLVLLSLGWNLTHHWHLLTDLALSQGRIAFDKDVMYRRWNAGVSPVYVKVSDSTPPNPHLEDWPERDISTPSGVSLTLMNPAYMTRLVHELGELASGVRAHITSLNPLRPENRPDDWERSALLKLEEGSSEVSEIQLMENGLSYMRVMRPLATEQVCIKCHGKQGYREGDIRGGISVSVPLGPMQEAFEQHLWVMGTGHALLWLVVLVLLAWAAGRIRNQMRHRFEVEAELKLHQDQLEDLVESRTAELRASQQEAEHLSRVKGEFLAKMSHEIRTPLNAILGFAQLGLLESPSRKTREGFDRIRESGESLRVIVDDILDFSRLQAGELSVEYEVISLRDLLDRMRRLVHGRLRRDGPEFHLDPAPDLPASFRGDGLRLAQVLRNLLVNALKFTEKGSIGLAVFRDRDWLVFRVSDTGIGMSGEQVARLFVPFEQGDGSRTRKYGGTGLGLSIAKRLLEQMGGRIRVESGPRQGSCFEARVPLLEAQGRLEMREVANDIRVHPHAAATRGPEDPAASTVVDPKRLRQCVWELERLLAADDTRAVAVYGESQELFRSAFGSAADELGRQIEGFDFEIASRTLHELMGEWASASDANSNY